MKKYLKFPLYMAFTAMIGMSVTACSDDDNPENPEETGGLSVQEQALKDVITDYTDKTVIPTYKGMADAAMQLHSLCIPHQKSGRNLIYRRCRSSRRSLENRTRLLGKKRSLVIRPCRRLLHRPAYRLMATRQNRYGCPVKQSGTNVTNGR